MKTGAQPYSKGTKFATAMKGKSSNGHFTTPGEGGQSPFMGTGANQGIGRYSSHLTTPGEGGTKEYTFVDRTKELWNSTGFKQSNVNRTDATDDRKQMAGMP